MPDLIYSRGNERIKYACHIASSAEFRAKERLFFAEGLRLCQDLAQRQAPRQVFATQAVYEKATAFFEALDGCDVFLVNEGVAEKLSDTKTPQGLFCLFEMPRYTRQDLCLDKGILLCENLQDPANVGTVVRSAAGLGLGGVVFTRGSADVYAPKALRAGMGSVLRIPHLQQADLSDTARAFLQAGATLYGAALEQSVPLQEIRAAKPYVLLIGNEGAGLTPAALDFCQCKVRIPMENGVESLNAAAAASMLMYAFTIK